MDFIIDSIAIEVRSTTNVQKKHLCGLLTLQEGKICRKSIVVPQDSQTRYLENGNIWVYPWQEFIWELWAPKSNVRWYLKIQARNVEAFVASGIESQGIYALRSCGWQDTVMWQKSFCKRPKTDSFCAACLQETLLLSVKTFYALAPDFLSQMRDLRLGMGFAERSLETFDAGGLP